MVSAIISVIFGVFTFLGAPIVLPVLGIALAINTLLKERKKETKNKKAYYTAIAGILLNIYGMLFAIVQTAIKLSQKS
jgi:hypothetical protein